MIAPLPCDKCVSYTARDQLQDAFSMLNESAKLLGIHYRAYCDNNPGAEISRVYAANLCRDIAEQATVLRERLLGEVTRS